LVYDFLERKRLQLLEMRYRLWWFVGCGLWVNDCGSFLGVAGNRLWQALGFGVAGNTIAAQG